MMVCYAVFKNADFNQILNILHARCTNVNTSLYFSTLSLTAVGLFFIICDTKVKSVKDWMKACFQDNLCGWDPKDTSA